MYKKFDNLLTPTTEHLIDLDKLDLVQLYHGGSVLSFIIKTIFNTVLSNGL